MANRLGCLLVVLGLTGLAWAGLAFGIAAVVSSW